MVRVPDLHGGGKAQRAAGLPLKGGPDDTVLRLNPVSKAIGLPLVPLVGLPVAVDGPSHALHLLLAVVEQPCSHPLHVHHVM